jgi:hypothetical protein
MMPWRHTKGLICVFMRLQFGYVDIDLQFEYFPEDKEQARWRVGSCKGRLGTHRTLSSELSYWLHRRNDMT